MAHQPETTFFPGPENHSAEENPVMGPLPFSVRTTFRHLFDYFRSRLPSAPPAEQQYLSGLIAALESAPELLADNVPPEALAKHRPLLLEIMNTAFPFVGQNEQRLGFMAAPFSQQILHLTPDMQTIYADEEVEVGFNLPREELARYWILNACRFLLGYYYDQWVPPEVPASLTVRSPATGLERYFGLQINTEFVQPQWQGDLPVLSEATIHELIHHPKDTDRWLSVFPLGRFDFGGVIFVRLTDITEQEILARIKNNLLSSKMETMQRDQDHLLELLRCFFQRPELQAGVAGHDAFFRKLHPALARQISLLDHELVLLQKEDNPSSVYFRAAAEEKPFVIEDLSEWPDPTPLERSLLKRGIRSLLLIPIRESSGDLAGIMEIGDPEPGVFNHTTTARLRDLTPLLILGVLQKREMMETMIHNTVQQQFTNIHPSVRWRFEEAAVEWLMARDLEGEKASLPNIVFHEVYPLYGQADIVGSSTKRYEAIRTDLIENLNLIGEIFNKVDATITSYLVHYHYHKVKDIRDRLQEYFSSSDESEVINLIRKEIHPFLKQLATDHPTELRDEVDQYFAGLDPHLNIIYRRRKDYENSINRLNREVSHLVESANQEMQRLLPHYFEKYTTDGVEFNLYLGQSLLPDRQFSPFHLREFRLWQLVLLCRITRHVVALQQELPLPLNTAQLLFVYSDPMDISFRMEEKQFDVEGAYNVRYEILKKRIDKSVIEGTGERLRAIGKIAIVYLHERDRREYREYLEYLSNEGWTTGDPEELRLAPVQGVEGLRALRVTVAP